MERIQSLEESQSIEREDQKIEEKGAKRKGWEEAFSEWGKTGGDVFAKDGKRCTVIFYRRLLVGSIRQNNFNDLLRTNQVTAEE